MKELLVQLNHKSLDDFKTFANVSERLALIDTCFFLDDLRHHKNLELLGKNLAMTSFNAEELVYVGRHLPDDIKKSIRHFFKKNKDFMIIDVPVSPGDSFSEKKFVSKIDKKLLELIPDPSDAVLLATAVFLKSIVLTKDKHHLFTTVLENYLDDSFKGGSVKVFKEMKDYIDYFHTLNL